jgi:hypothetical protein
MSMIAWIALGVMLAGALGLLLAWCLRSLEPVAACLVVVRGELAQHASLRSRLRTTWHACGGASRSMMPAAPRTARRWHAVTDKCTREGLGP